jgi:hypothetical protein
VRWSRLFAVLGLSLAAVGLYVAAGLLGWLGRHEGAGVPTRARIPATVVGERAGAQREAAAALTVAPPAKQVLFGDLHVHTTFSADAFLTSLPMLQGDGAHPVSDACDFARFCSALDFWSINDHAESLTPRRWRETREAIRQCNAIAGDPESPDVVAFLGWEWTQVGATPASHFGHKNVVLRATADDEVPARPIAAAGLATDALRGGLRMPRVLPFLDFRNRQRYWNLLTFLEEIAAVSACPEDAGDGAALPDDCYETAAEPADLFRKLAAWGHEALVIPHGNTWGFYSPPGTSWDKQLVGAQHDPERQRLIEVMSGHGNSEEFRDWLEVEIAADGSVGCPAPRPDYLPSCWRAGEIVAERCRAAGLEAAECERRAADARRHHAEAGVVGHRAVPGATGADWLDAGQCRDCFLPAFNYRPRGSAQYALAISNFAEPEPDGRPRRFQLGFIASSDVHQARPGTGYKEFGRHDNTETAGPPDARWRERLAGADEAPEPVSRPVDPAAARRSLLALEAERQASFFLTGGLAAVHAEGRSRDAVWDALRRREVYGTSGDRILLWFHLLNARDGEGGAIGAVPMGGEARPAGVPRFEVRAVGAQKQRPGCPDWSEAALGAARIASLCKGECFHPAEERKLVTRIEVVRIRPQAAPGEPVAGRIEDPWRVFPCPPSQAGCVVQFEDPDFPAAGRDALYYVRAVQEPSDAVNAASLRCTRDEAGNCLAVDPCYGDPRTPKEDDCLAPAEERAWSSPIYLTP